jgi:hypothetical protein
MKPRRTCAASQFWTEPDTPGRRDLDTLINAPSSSWPSASTSSPSPARNVRASNLIFDRRYAYVTRPLRYSINVTLDGCCDHREIPAGEDLHRHAVGKPRPGRCSPLWPGDLRNDGGRVSAADVLRRRTQPRATAFGVSGTGDAVPADLTLRAAAARRARVEANRSAVCQTYPSVDTAA